jgi:peptidoglycan hydrolase-like protein with peptidoglycan-binding domain
MRSPVYGVVALGLLAAACGGERVASDPGTAAPGEARASSAIVVRQAQSELKREGLYAGAIDGVAGPETRQGIASFQRREGLQPTARVDAATRDRLVVNALRLESAWSEAAPNSMTAERPQLRMRD